MDFIISTLKPFLEDRREDDAFDRLNYKLTPLLLLLSAAVNTAKLYIGGVIECFTKAEFAFASGWIEYTRDYCFVENTYYLYEHESDDTSHDFRSERYISYYQWVPFILGLQALSFFIPHFIFRSFNWITGYHIYSIVSTAADNRMGDERSRRKAISVIANVLYKASKCHHQWLWFNGQKFITYMYFGMKLFYLILICLNMYVYKVFIGNLTFAMDVLHSGVEWRSSGLFPRVTVCDMQILRFGAPLNYTMECVLPLNMFNEKIFVFFYFWMLILFGLNAWSLFVWYKRMSYRKHFFKRLLISFTRDESNWRIDSARTPDSIDSADGKLDESETLIPTRSDKYGVTVPNVDYGWDMRLVLGLLKEHVGILFTSAIFKQVNLLKEHELQKKGKNVSNSSSE